MPAAEPALRGWDALNPRATLAERAKARAVARAVAAEYSKRGTRAVLLAGSWVRGDAHRHSDIDLWILGRRRDSEALWREPFVVSISHTTETAERRKFREPGRLGGVIPGWRLAIPLYDPDGIAARLKSEARRFRWNDVAEKCDRWVGESLVGWGEEAVKLVRALSEGRLQTACVQRNLLADALGFVMAIHRRMFWDSENEFWERIGAAVGGAWQAAQATALCDPRSDPERTCLAALDLYRETARETRGVLRGDRLAVVTHTCEVIGRPLS